jgi:hypothetical protein
VVVGEAGIGKTALWLTATEEAAARGYLVLSCRPSDAEARFSFSGLADLLSGHVAQVLPQLAGPQRSALQTALGLSFGSPVGERLVAFAFFNALRRLGESHRVVIAVDDVQCLDEPSASLLSYALARLETEPVVALLTAHGAAPSWLGGSPAAGQLLEVELGALSVGALHEMLRTRVDVAFPRPVLLRIWETSGGNPFFALELARALQAVRARCERTAVEHCQEMVDGKTDFGSVMPVLSVGVRWGRAIGWVCKPEGAGSNPARSTSKVLQISIFRSLVW